jgi:hypoxanthine phosphoribosyltransferase
LDNATTKSSPQNPPQNPKIGKTVFAAEQIQKRVGEIARQISADYAGKHLHTICVLENGFMFMSDLVRQLEVPVICDFVRTNVSEKVQGNIVTREIHYGPETDVKGHDVLLIEAIVQSGITSEFLIRNFSSRGAKSVKLAALLDKQSERKVMLHPDYFGFLLDESFVVGYGLGAPELGRNLPYIGALVR